MICILCSIRIVPRFSPTYFCIHTKLIFIQSFCSQWEKKQLASISLTGTLMMYCPIKQPRIRKLSGARCILLNLRSRDTTESTTSASYLDLLQSIGRDGQLHTSIYDKRDDFNFHITNFLFLSSNIPSSPAYGVFLSLVLSLNLYGTPGLAPRMNVLF